MKFKLLHKLLLQYLLLEKIVNIYIYIRINLINLNIRIEGRNPNSDDTLILFQYDNSKNVNILSLFINMFYLIIIVNFVSRFN
jgi:hypothetical protein